MHVLIIGSAAILTPIAFFFLYPTLPAFLDGAGARALKQPRAVCPYDEGPKREAWFLGYNYIEDRS
jgi:hypothetical protein